MRQLEKTVATLTSQRLTGVRFFTQTGTPSTVSRDNVLIRIRLI